MEELHKAKCILFSKNKKNQIIYMFKSLLKMSYVYSLTGCGMREKSDEGIQDNRNFNDGMQDKKIRWCQQDLLICRAGFGIL